MSCSRYVARHPHVTGGHIREAHSVVDVAAKELTDHVSTITAAAPASIFNRASRALGRTTAPFTRRLAGRRFFPLWAVVHHHGRRSGHTYATPVAIRASADTFTIPVPWGDQTQWVRNVIAAGGCTIRWRGADYPAMDPVLIGQVEAAPAFSPLQRAVIRAVGMKSFLRLSRAPSPMLSRSSAH
jgi:deazaflavin-dependent oxidoreductase (nitroreductase family)